MCVNKFLLPFFRSWLNACHPPSPLLFSVPLVSIRLTRLWTILCPVSIVLAQPALRAARKVMFITCTHSPHFLRCLSRCFNLYNSQLHLSLPLSFSAPRCSCLFIQRLAAVVLAENSEVGVEFQSIQLSHWVDVCFVFLLWRCRTHRIFMWETQTYCELSGSGGADTHTDRLSHFSFFLPANSFCISFLSLLSASLSQQSTVCSHFLHTCLTHLQQQPGCLSLLCSTESLTTFSLVRLNVPSLGKS